MPDLLVPTWLAPILGLGLPAAGWFGRKVFERRWERADRKIARAEANLEEQLRLLRHLNGELYQKWVWLADHRDAEDLTKAGPTANEIGTWLYRHSAYFPERIRITMVNLGHLTFNLATVVRAEVLQYRLDELPKMWAFLRDYQRKVEKKLGVE